MGVEICELVILPNEENPRKLFVGLTNYKCISIYCVLKQGNVQFENCFNEKEQIELFKSWHSKEKDVYEKYVINYFKEINKINDVSSFKGKIIREEKIKSKTHQTKYQYDIEFNHFPYNISLTLVPSINFYELKYDVPIAYNSKGQIARNQSINYILKEETVKRMWNPFRDKTKYRLELLHMLR